MEAVVWGTAYLKYRIYRAYVAYREAHGVPERPVDRDPPARLLNTLLDRYVNVRDDLLRSGMILGNTVRALKEDGSDLRRSLEGFTAHLQSPRGLRNSEDLETDVRDHLLGYCFPRFFRQGHDWKPFAEALQHCPDVQGVRSFNLIVRGSMTSALSALAEVPGFGGQVQIRIFLGIQYRKDVDTGSDQPDPIAQIVDEDYWPQLRLPEFMKWLLFPGHDSIRAESSTLPKPDDTGPTVAIMDSLEYLSHDVADLKQRFTVVGPARLDTRTLDKKLAARINRLSRIFNDYGTPIAYELCFEPTNTKSGQIQLRDRRGDKETVLATIDHDRLVGRPLPVIFLDPTEQYDALESVATVRVGNPRFTDRNARVANHLDQEMVAIECLTKSLDGDDDRLCVGDIVLSSFGFTKNRVTLITGTGGELNGTPTTQRPGNNMIIIRPEGANESQINPKFLWLLLRYGRIGELLVDASDKQLARITSTQVRNLPIIPNPPMAEQDQIVAKFEQLREVIDKAKNELETHLASLKETE